MTLLQTCFVDKSPGGLKVFANVETIYSFLHRVVVDAAAELDAGDVAIRKQIENPAP